MRAALMTTTGWLDEELDQFRRLIVGLIDEQVRVTQILPYELPSGEAVTFGDQLFFSQSRWPYWTCRRLMRLQQPLGQQEVDLIDAQDSALWHAATSLCKRLDIPVVLTCFSQNDLPVAKRLHHQLDAERTVFVATTEPLAEQLRQVVSGTFRIELIPRGVHRIGESAERFADATLCIVVTGNGRNDHHYEQLLDSFHAVIESHPGTQFFLDGMGSDQRTLWRAVSKRKLLPHVSFVPRKLGHRELLLHADMIVQPQALGRSRSLLLEAMARGLFLAARHDPINDVLIDGQTCRTIRESDAATWAEVLIDAANDPAACKTLGDQARQWVQQHRHVSTQIDATIDLYRQVVDASLPFDSSAAGGSSA